MLGVGIDVTGARWRMVGGDRVEGLLTESEPIALIQRVLDGQEAILVACVRVSDWRAHREKWQEQLRGLTGVVEALILPAGVPANWAQAYQIHSNEIIPRYHTNLERPICTLTVVSEGIDVVLCGRGLSFREPFSQSYSCAPEERAAFIKRIRDEWRSQGVGSCLVVGEVDGLSLDSSYQLGGPWSNADGAAMFGMARVQQLLGEHI